jgi:RNA-directed DNA polymerase
MEKSNQQPMPEDCLPKGGEMEASFHCAERWAGSVSREKREPQAGPASCLSNSASKATNAGGEAVKWAEPRTKTTAKGEVVEGLPGSKSVARAEGNTSNEGGLEDACRTNYENQAGRPAQRQGAQAHLSGVGLANSIQGQPRKSGPTLEKEPTEQRKSAQATSPVRKTGQDWPTFLRAIAEKASTNKQHRFGGLYRWLNKEVLRQSFFLLRRDAASGVDGVTFEAYQENLEANLEDLVGRLKRKAYRAKLVRRKYIPKGNTGKLRPLGIPALEDKLLQVAVTQILQVIYEVDFLPCSYGYRPGKSAHDALKLLSEELQFGEHNFVVEADIKGFFDNIQWEWLERMLAQRIDDGAFLNLIGKWLRAGIMEEDGQVVHPQTGTPQGGVVSPVLANIYLHYVLDLWFERKVKPRNQGCCVLVRYADDFVACFEYRHEAGAFERELKTRLAKFGLEVAVDKTKTLRFGWNGGEHNGRFDFLGFEFHWGTDRKGRPNLKRRTATKKHLVAIQRVSDWIKENRHRKLAQLMTTLRAKLQGAWNYYGIIGNGKRLQLLYAVACQALHKWLNRRSQRRSYTWRALNRLLQRWQVPRPRIVEVPSRGMPCQTEMSFCQRMTPGHLRDLFRRAHARAS